VLAAGQGSSPEGQAALEQLCQTYWYPLYSYVRRDGYSHQDAQDLIQEFFHRFLEGKYLQKADPNQGRFRTFLLTSLRDLLVSKYHFGRTEVLSLDEELAAARIAEPATEQPPDTLYDQAWADIVTNRAMSSLRAEFEQSGKLKRFERLKVYAFGGRRANNPVPPSRASLGRRRGH
jgi:RNA polymerase sigma-70 factor (ECF subfamily)